VAATERRAGPRGGSATKGRISARRAELAGMRIVFAVYLALITGGIVFYAIVGLTHN
jgi:hypothetical protein